MNNDLQNPSSTRRPLENLIIGVSVSHDPDSRSGYNNDAMNRIIIRLGERLLAAGASLAFGHDWRPNGVMSAVARLAARYQPNNLDEDRKKDDKGHNDRDNKCRITNFVAWDNKPELPKELREDLQLRGVLKIEEIIPVNFDDLSRKLSRDELRIESLRVMRQHLAKHCNARICLGGKTKGYQGIAPGIFEEAIISATLPQPLYISSILGGAAQLLTNASRENNWSILINPVVKNLEKFPEASLRCLKDATGYSAESLLNESMLREYFNWHALRKRSGLNAERWRLLTESQDIELIGTLIVHGLSRLAPELLMAGS